MKQKAIYFSVIVCFISCKLFAQNNPIIDVTQLHGCWKKINFPDAITKQMNKVDPWPRKYQWYCFEQDGTLSSMHSSVDEKITKEELLRSFAILPKTFSYELGPRGIIKTWDKAGLQTLFWPSAFLGKDVSAEGIFMKKGTLIMSLHSPEQSTPIYYRYLSRIDE